MMSDSVSPPSSHEPAAEAKSTLQVLQERLQTQDNRCTAQPLFIVEERDRIYGVDPCFGHDSLGSIWLDPEEPSSTIDSFEELVAYVKSNNGLTDANDEDLIPEDFDEDDSTVELAGDTYTRTYYISVWRFVCAHFTEAAAQAYIRQNAHRLTSPRVYVTSQYRCHEWNAVRDRLLEGAL